MTLTGQLWPKSPDPDEFEPDELEFDEIEEELVIVRPEIASEDDPEWDDVTYPWFDLGGES